MCSCRIAVIQQLSKVVLRAKQHRKLLPAVFYNYEKRALDILGNHCGKLHVISSFKRIIGIHWSHRLKKIRVTDAKRGKTSGSKW